VTIVAATPVAHARRHPGSPGGEEGARSRGERDEKPPAADAGLPHDGETRGDGSLSSGRHDGIVRPEAAASVVGGTPGAGRVERAGVAHAGSLAAEHVARVAELREAAAPRPLSQLVLRMDGDGGPDRVRIEVRDGAVAATLETGDHTLAERVARDVGTLREALQQHGLGLDAVRVRAAAQAAALTLPDRGPVTGGAASTPQRHDGRRDAPDHHSRRESGDDRQRPRRDQRGNRPR
jgi:hypothetical protein